MTSGQYQLFDMVPPWCLNKIALLDVVPDGIRIIHFQEKGFNNFFIFDILSTLKNKNFNFFLKYFWNEKRREFFATHGKSINNVVPHHSNNVLNAEFNKEISRSLLVLVASL